VCYGVLLDGQTRQSHSPQIAPQLQSTEYGVRLRREDEKLQIEVQAGLTAVRLGYMVAAYGFRCGDASASKGVASSCDDWTNEGAREKYYFEIAGSSAHMSRTALVQAAGGLMNILRLWWTMLANKRRATPYHEVARMLRSKR
jgi:hypothetical protein